MESHQEQLASPRIDDDADDGKRDWASLPHDLVRTIMGAPQLKRDKAAKWAALASCKAFGRAVMRASSHNLGMQLDHRTSFSRRARFWAELWGGEPRRQGQDAGLALFSVSLVNPALCFGELLSAGLCLPFVTQLSFKVRGVAGREHQAPAVGLITTNENSPRCWSPARRACPSTCCCPLA